MTVKIDDLALFSMIVVLHCPTSESNLLLLYLPLTDTPLSMPSFLVATDAIHLGYHII